MHAKKRPQLISNDIEINFPGEETVQDIKVKLAALFFYQLSNVTQRGLLDFRNSLMTMAQGSY